MPVVASLLSAWAWYVTSNRLAGVFLVASAGMLVRVRWLEHMAQWKLILAFNPVPRGWVEHPVSRVAHATGNQSAGMPGAATR